MSKQPQYIAAQTRDIRAERNRYRILRNALGERAAKVLLQRERQRDALLRKRNGR